MQQTSTPKIVISGSGIWTPSDVLTNDELITSYNDYAKAFNTRHAREITAGTVEEKQLSSKRFIEKASGIKQRYVYSKHGITDPQRMYPKFGMREESEISHQAEIAVFAAREAMKNANKKASDIDAVIIACSFLQRPLPAIAVEVQNALGINGFGFDMQMACASSSIGLSRAYDCIKAGSAKCVLTVNPELLTPQTNYCDRTTHFVFGDAATAIIMERDDNCTAMNRFEVLGTKVTTQYSNNIRSNFGPVLRVTDEDYSQWGNLIHQAGRKVFEEITPIVIKHITDHLSDYQTSVDEIKRYWLHQANVNVNKIIIKNLIGNDQDAEKTPTIVNQYGNTASAGSILAFHLFKDDFSTEDLGVICSFGAGYSVGSLILQKQ